MPLTLHQLLSPKGELGLWEIKEDEKWFRDRLDLSTTESDQLKKIKGHKRLEWLAARMLIHSMSGRDKRGFFIKDEFGKPYLTGSPFNISISHSRKYAAAIAAPESVGIDIQSFVPKIERITHKFMSKAESDMLDSKFRLWHLHIYWSAKEALYKAYGRRKLNFCEHIIIKPFEYQKQAGQFFGEIIKDKEHFKYQLDYKLYKDYVLVYAKEM
ncbi:MAG: 4'-phosphopantetheinyl transferase superfamily protein [Bacteroidota bacterium]